MVMAKEASKGPHSLGYDNIQFSTSIFVEQRFLGPPTMQTGTTGIIYRLLNATEEACLLRPLLEHIQKAPDISFNWDIRPSIEQLDYHSFQLRIHIINALIDMYPKLESLGRDPRLQFRERRHPGLHKTEEFI